MSSSIRSSSSVIGSKPFPCRAVGRPFTGGREPERCGGRGCSAGVGRVADDLDLTDEVEGMGGCDSARAFLEGGARRSDEAFRFNGRLEDGCNAVEPSRLLDSACETEDSRMINKPLRVGSAFASPVLDEESISLDTSSGGKKTRTFALVGRL